MSVDMGVDAHVEDDLPSMPICLVGSKSDLASFSSRTRSYSIADNLQIRSVGLVHHLRFDDVNDVLTCFDVERSVQ